MSVMLLAVLAIISFVIGIGASAIGVTAWMMLVPIMFVLFGFNLYLTLFISLLVDCGNALIMTVYARQNNELDLRTGLKMTVTATPFVLLGVYLGTTFIAQHAEMFKMPAVFVNLFFGLAFIRRGYKMGKLEREGLSAETISPADGGRGTMRAGLIYPAMAYVGVQIGLFGIGGGMMIAIALMFCLAFPTLKATGTAMLTTMMMTIIAASIIYFQIPVENGLSRPVVILMLTMIFFSMVGTILGARLVYSLSLKKMNYLIAAVIILAAIVAFVQNVVNP